MFFPVFTHSFDKRSMLLLYWFSTGVHHRFHATIVPSVVYLPRLFTSSRNPVIFVFLFLVVKLIVGSLFPRWKASHRRRGFVPCCSTRWRQSWMSAIIIPVFSVRKCEGGREEGGAVFLFSFSPRVLPFIRSDFFLLFSVVCLKRESPDGCEAKNHKYWVPSFGELNVLSSVKSLAQRQHYLVVLVLFVTIWMPSPMAGSILEVYLSHLEAEKTKKNKLWQNSH